MAIRSLLVCVGAVVGLAAAGAAACTVPQPPNAPPPAPTQAPALPTMPPMLAALAGDWDGAMTVRQDKWTSSSIANMSIRTQPDGSLLAAWDGFVNGDPANGMLRIAVRQDSPQPELASFVSHLNASIRASMTASSPDRLMFAGQMKDPASNSLRIEQSLRVIENDHLIIEMVALAQDGTRTPVLMLDLSRLPDGQHATAADHLQDRAMLDRVAPPRAQANAPEPPEGR